REGRVHLPPLRPIVILSVRVSAELNPGPIHKRSRQRLTTHPLERLRIVLRLRRRPNVELQTKLRGVHRGEHVRHRLIREDLRLIEDQNINTRNTTTEPTLTRTKQDARPIVKT